MKPYVVAVLHPQEPIHPGRLLSPVARRRYITITLFRHLEKVAPHVTGEDRVVIADNGVEEAV